MAPEFLNAELLSASRLPTSTQFCCFQNKTRHYFLTVTQEKKTDSVIFCNKIVREINTERLNGLETEGYTIDSINISASCKTFNPTIKDGRVGNTAFMNTLEIKENARVMMIHNVDVNDHLTNGSLGEVVGVDKNSKGMLDFFPSDVLKIIKLIQIHTALLYVLTLFTTIREKFSIHINKLINQ